MITGKFPELRLRRSRKNYWSRRLIEENNLTSNDFILPIFLIDGKNKKQSIKSMPGVYRYTIDKLNFIVDKAIKKKLPMIALFPYTDKKKKNALGTEALNENNIVCKALQKINIALSIIDENDNNRAMINDTKAEILWKLGETNKAIIIINESIDLDPENQYYQNQKNKFLNSIK